MFTIQSDSVRWFLPLLVFMIQCFCDAANVNFPPIDIQHLIRNEFFYTKNTATNLTILNPIIQSNSNNWTTENQHCLKELNDIANGMNNFEEWAVKSNVMCETSNQIQLT